MYLNLHYFTNVVIDFYFCALAFFEQCALNSRKSVTENDVTTLDEIKLLLPVEHSTLKVVKLILLLFFFLSSFFLSFFLSFFN